MPENVSLPRRPVSLSTLRTFQSLCRSSSGLLVTIFNPASVHVSLTFCPNVCFVLFQRISEVSLGSSSYQDQIAGPFWSRPLKLEFPAWAYFDCWNQWYCFNPFLKALLFSICLWARKVYCNFYYYFKNKYILTNEKFFYSHFSHQYCETVKIFEFFFYLYNLSFVYYSSRQKYGCSWLNCSVTSVLSNPQWDGDTSVHLKKQQICSWMLRTTAYSQQYKLAVSLHMIMREKYVIAPKATQKS